MVFHKPWFINPGKTPLALSKTLLAAHPKRIQVRVNWGLMDSNLMENQTTWSPDDHVKQLRSRSGF
jgi:hypothetical protein